MCAVSVGLGAAIHPGGYTLSHSESRYLSSAIRFWPIFALANPLFPIGSTSRGLPHRRQVTVTSRSCTPMLDPAVSETSRAWNTVPDDTLHCVPRMMLQFSTKIIPRLSLSHTHSAGNGNKNKRIVSGSCCCSLPRSPMMMALRLEKGPPAKPEDGYSHIVDKMIPKDPPKIYSPQGRRLARPATSMRLPCSLSCTHRPSIPFPLCPASFLPCDSSRLVPTRKTPCNAARSNRGYLKEYVRDGKKRIDAESGTASVSQ